MSGVFLLIPFFLARFGLLALCNRDAVKRAAHFAPMRKEERWAYWLYQLSTAAILVSLCFLRVDTSTRGLFWTGAALTGAGMVLLTASAACFASPEESGINRRGAYRFSRNPMYAAYFLIFLGCSLLTRSLLLFVLVIALQVSAHWIVLAEERWCLQKFGEEYRTYMKQVRRY